MISFKEYESRPITRKAHQITVEDQIRKLREESMYAIGQGDSTVKFKAHQRVSEGDYVVYLNDKDIYHCTKEVFEERNIVS